MTAKEILIYVVILFGLLFGIGRCATTLNIDEINNVKIKEKGIKRDKSSDIYLVYTKNHGVFKVTDSWLDVDFSASDRYGNIQINKCYNIKTRGVRFPFLSWYKNIIKMENVKCK